MIGRLIVLSAIAFQLSINTGLAAGERDSAVDESFVRVAEAKPANNLSKQLESLFNFDDPSALKSEEGSGEKREVSPIAPHDEDPIFKALREAQENALERLRRYYVERADRGEIEDFVGGEEPVPPPGGKCPNERTTFANQPVLALCRYGAVGVVQTDRSIDPSTVKAPITQWWHKYRAVVFADACAAGADRGTAVDLAMREASLLALDSARQQVASLDNRFRFERRENLDVSTCRVLRAGR